MKSTAIVLSMVMFTSACRAADTGQVAQTSAPAPVPPAGNPGPAEIIRGGSTSSRPAESEGKTVRPGARVQYTPARSNPLATTDGDWVMVRRGDASKATEKGAYLGLSVAPVPTVLRDQLKLQRNVGLVVNFVEKDSPAEAAGFRPSDVLQKLDEQILIDTHQFAVLVRMHDVNQDVRFTVIREAKPIELTVKLVERDLAAMDDSSDGIARMYKLIGDRGAAVDNDAEARYRDFSEKMLSKQLKAFGLESRDDKHQFSISYVDGHRHLVARDAEGKVLFEGPIDTNEQIEQLPDEIRGKVVELKRKMNWPAKGPVGTEPAKPVAPVPPTPPTPPVKPAPPPPAPAPRSLRVLPSVAVDRAV